MYIGSKESVLRAYLKHYVPANHWYFTKNNGIVQVVHARAAILETYEDIQNLKPGHASQHFDIWWRCAEWQVMHFTDCTDAVGVKDQRKRRGVVGNMREFERFKDHFVLREQAYLFIPTPQKIRDCSGYTLGHYTNPDDFQYVLDVSRKTVEDSEIEFRKV